MQAKFSFKGQNATGDSILPEIIEDMPVRAMLNLTGVNPERVRFVVSDDPERPVREDGRVSYFVTPASASRPGVVGYQVTGEAGRLNAIERPSVSIYPIEGRMLPGMEIEFGGRYFTLLCRYEEHDRVAQGSKPRKSLKKKR